MKNKRKFEFSVEYAFLILTILYALIIAFTGAAKVYEAVEETKKIEIHQTK